MCINIVREGMLACVYVDQGADNCHLSLFTLILNPIALHIRPMTAKSEYHSLKLNGETGQLERHVWTSNPDPDAPRRASWTRAEPVAAETEPEAKAKRHKGADDFRDNGKDDFRDKGKGDTKGADDDKGKGDTRGLPESGAYMKERQLLWLYGASKTDSIVMHSLLMGTWHRDIEQPDDKAETYYYHSIKDWA
jgi:hypothetical protein